VVLDEHVQAMDQVVKNYHKAIDLISLKSSHNSLTKAAGKPSANILQAQHKMLQKLDMSYSQITCAGFGDLLEALTMDHPPLRLVHLDLTETQFGGKEQLGSLPVIDTTKVLKSQHALGLAGLRELICRRRRRPPPPPPAVRPFYSNFDWLD
jgi:hypothetical protein